MSSVKAAEGLEMAEDSGEVAPQDDEADSSLGTAAPGANRRACDACRARKVRCDKASPCSYCVRAGVSCTLASNKPRERRTRILLTPQYERKIDSIDRQLEGVMKLLREVKLQLPPAVSPELASIPSTAAPKETVSFESSQTGTPQSDTDSAWAMQSAFASEFIHRMVGKESHHRCSAGMQQSLESLRQVVQGFCPPTLAMESTYPNAGAVRHQVPDVSNLPPMEKVGKLLHHARGQSFEGIGLINKFFPIRNFSELCLSVYFSQEASSVDFITVNTGLYWMFKAHASEADGTEKQESVRFSEKCRNNVENSLANLSLYLQPTEETLIALLCGAYYTAAILKPLLSWSLISKAAEICQSLEYHRQESMDTLTPEEVEYRQSLFWRVYGLEKLLSMRLARASNIQDWDVTVPIPTVDSTQSSLIHPVTVHTRVNIRLSRCHGDMYELLYSPKARAQPVHVLDANVQQLATELEAIGDQMRLGASKFAHSEEAAAKDLMEVLLYSLDTTRLSLLTLVHRSSSRNSDSSGLFTPNSINTARRVMDVLGKFVDVMDKKGSTSYLLFVQHGLFYASIPFVTLFFHIVGRKDQSDLPRLESLIGSFRSLPRKTVHMERMCHFFDILYDVARRYFEPPTSPTAVPEQAQTGEQSNSLAAGTVMGAFPQQQDNNGGLAQQTLFDEAGTQSPTAQGHGNFTSFMWMDDVAQLEDWMYGDSQLREMLSGSDALLPDYME